MTQRNDYKRPIDIDWESNCVDAIVGHILGNDHMKKNFVNILSRALLRLQERKEAEDRYYGGFRK